MEEEEEEKEKGKIHENEVVEEVLGVAPGFRCEERQTSTEKRR